MLEVVFHDSAKGALLIAQHYRSEDECEGIAMAIGSIGGVCGGPARRPSAGRPLGGNHEDVIGLSLYLDVGDISGDLFGERREAVLRSLFSCPEGEDAAQELMEVSCADRDHLLDAAARGEPVRIWHSHAPSEACGLLHTVSLLEGLPCPIWTVKLPRVAPMPSGWKEYSCWNDVMPGEFADFAEGQRLLDDTERRALAAHWRRLERENAPLRAVLNGGVRSVPEAFYDYLIDRHMPEGEFVEAQLIGKILGEEPMGLSDGWFFRRIEARIGAGELRVTRPAEEGHPYLRRLKRT
ncbi:MAG: DUF3658 domain-containing protein [Clostridia bacterium]|nr:DUF3658 domain-containing protein [Clostridia bacterium]